jgi:hypothetical protein
MRVNVSFLRSVLVLFFSLVGVFAQATELTWDKQLWVCSENDESRNSPNHLGEILKVDYRLVAEETAGFWRSPRFLFELSVQTDTAQVDGLLMVENKNELLVIIDQMTSAKRISYQGPCHTQFSMDGVIIPQSAHRDVETVPWISLSTRNRHFRLLP